MRRGVGAQAKAVLNKEQYSTEVVVVVVYLVPGIAVCTNYLLTLVTGEHEFPTGGEFGSKL